MGDFRTIQQSLIALQAVSVTWLHGFQNLSSFLSFFLPSLLSFPSFHFFLFSFYMLMYLKFRWILKLMMDHTLINNIFLSWHKRLIHPLINVTLGSINMISTKEHTEFSKNPLVSLYIMCFAVLSRSVMSDSLQSHEL